jgi:DNA-binding NarL/FixJ family response regulator
MLPILVLSMHSEPQIIERALAAGAQGYLVKGCDAEQIVEAVRRIAAGALWEYRPPAPLPQASAWTLYPFAARIEALHDEGCPPEEIASRLGLDVGAVRRCLEQVEQARRPPSGGDTLPGGNEDAGDT